MKKLFYTTVLVLLSFISFSQELNNTLYFLRYSPQANYLNSAINPEADVWVGFPGFTSFAFQYNNNSFNIEDVLVKKGGGEKPVKIDINHLYDAMSQNSTINMNTEIALFSLGLRFKDDYWTLDIRNKNTVAMGFDKSFIGFFKEGTTPFLGKTIEFGDTQLNALAYNEIAFGYSHLFDVEHNFVLGAKLKFILGIASLDMTDSNLSMKIADDGMSANVKANTNIRLAGPVKFDETQGADFKIKDMEFDDSNILKTAFGTDNIGLGLDIGMQYSINEDISLYASVLDIGYINWSNAYNINMTADYNWSGINFSNQIKDSNIDAMEELSDDLEEEFKLNKKDKSFVQALPTKIYVGGQYNVKEWFKAGLLCRTQFYNGRVYSALTASGNFFTSKRLSASVSYTMANNSYNNIGFGFTTQTGPMQFYFVTDNILAANFTKAQLINFRFGMNIRVGLKNKPQAEVYID